MKTTLKSVAAAEGVWNALQNWVKAVCHKFRKRIKERWSNKQNREARQTQRYGPDRDKTKC